MPQYLGGEAALTVREKLRSGERDKVERKFRSITGERNKAERRQGKRNTRRKLMLIQHRGWRVMV